MEITQDIWAFWSILENDFKLQFSDCLKNNLSICGFSNAVAIKSMTTEDFTYVENYIRNKLPNIINKRNDCIDERYSCFFGIFTSNPEDFEFTLGEKRLMTEVIKYVNAKVDCTEPNFNLEYFKNTTNITSSKKHLWKRQMCTTPLGLFFGEQKCFNPASVKQQDANERNIDIDKLTDNLYMKAAEILNNYKQSIQKEVFTKNCVKVEYDGKVKGKVCCNYCDVMDSSREVKVFYQIIKGNGYWILANLSKHLCKKHSSTSENVRRNNAKSISNVCSSVHRNTSLVKLEIEKVIDGSDCANELINEYENELYKQMYVQSIEMTNSSYSNEEELIEFPIQFDLSQAIEPRKIIVCEISPNGHCLFGALAHQLYGSKINSTEHQSQTLGLRDAVVQHIGQHLPDYIKLLKGRIYEDNKKNEKKPIKGEKEIDECLLFLSKKLSSDKWGGAETLKAVSEMHDVNIVIINQDGLCNMPNRFNNQHQRTLIVYYRCFNDVHPVNVSNKDHYDSVVEIGSSTISEFAKDLMTSEKQFLQFKNKNTSVIVLE